MTWRIAFAALCAVLAVSPGFAQTARERAQQGLSGVVPIGDVLSRGTMENVVVPHETDTPPESGMSHTQFDSQEIQIQASDTPTGKAFNTQKDSALSRPSVSMDPNALDLANQSIEQADAVAGGLFSSSGGQCNEEFVPPSAMQGMQWCRSVVAQNLRVCEQWRDITVDRSDTWTCEVETGDYLSTCSKNVSWACTGTTGAACFQSALKVSGNSISWPGGGTIAAVAIPNRGGGCAIRTDTFYVSYADIMNLSSLHISSFDFYGAAQIKVNGSVAYAYAGRTGAYQVVDRNCGKNCTVKAIYEGGYQLEDCSTAHRSANLSINLKNYINVAAPGPSVESGLNISVPTGDTSNTVRIDIVRANYGENATSVNLTVGGSCCSEFTGTAGGTC